MVDEGDRAVEASPGWSGDRRGSRTRRPARAACRACRRCRRAPSSASGRSTGRTIARPLGAADPVRDLHRLEAHVVEAVVAHLPAAHASASSSAAEPVMRFPYPVGELGQALPRDVGRRAPRSRRCARPPAVVAAAIEAGRPRPPPPRPDAARDAGARRQQERPRHTRTARRVTGSSSSTARLRRFTAANHRHAG